MQGVHVVANSTKHTIQLILIFHSGCGVYRWSFHTGLSSQKVMMSEKNKVEESQPIASAVSNCDRSPSLASQMSPSLEKSSSRSKKRSSSASPLFRGNRIFNNIVTEQPRVQMKHYHYESFWKKVASEMNREISGIPIHSIMACCVLMMASNNLYHGELEIRILQK